ncbi:cell division topological specificity factor MinE [bacterium C-53]|nr:cell division topological specificity factor MinE [Lachnospiraceae bacterium]NBI01905.1 cell division topological specificity factor MinE [Lachnospiraceae bacterium]RKJ12308.1 cell division topological specificity factor MinE [bacterium C-53]
MNIMRFFRRKTSKDVAKDRLKLLLISDRANCTPEVMEMIKNDLIKVISKYMEIDVQGVDVEILKTKTENGKTPALYASIPILNLKNTFGNS